MFALIDSPRIRLGALNTLILPSILLGLMTGCQPGPRADYSQLDLKDVRGKVTLDGQPLVGATIRFENDADGSYSFGVTDQQGNYVMMLNSEQRGVMPGPKTVRITSLPTIESIGGGGEEGEIEEEASAPKQSAKEQVPARFNGKSELKFEVTQSASDVNFDLTSSASQDAP